MLLLFLLHHKSCTKGKCISSASSADGDSVLVDAILFRVGVEFFNDNIDVLGLSWVRNKWSISVVDKEVNSVSMHGRILETISFIEGGTPDVCTSMHLDVSWEILFAFCGRRLKTKNSNFTLSVKSLYSELVPGSIFDNILE